MTPVHSIIIVMIRIWAAGMLYMGILGFPIMVVSVRFQEANASDPLMNASDPLMMVYGVYYAVIILTAVIVWILAPKLARLALSVENQKSIDIKIDADLLVMLGSFLIGLYFLVRHVPDLVVNLGRLFWGEAPDNTGYYTEESFRQGLIIVLALSLVFRSQHLANLFRFLRYRGLGKDEATD